MYPTREPPSDSYLGCWGQELVSRLCGKYRANHYPLPKAQPRDWVFPFPITEIGSELLSLQVGLPTFRTLSAGREMGPSPERKIVLQFHGPIISITLGALKEKRLSTQWSETRSNLKRNPNV